LRILMPKDHVDVGRVSMSNGYGVDQSITNPFFDASLLTEEQILSKMSDVDKKISAAFNSGASQSVIEQMYAVKDALSREFSERSMKRFGSKDNGEQFDGLIG